MFIRKFQLLFLDDDESALPDIVFEVWSLSAEQYYHASEACNALNIVFAVVGGKIY